MIVSLLKHKPMQIITHTISQMHISLNIYLVMRKTISQELCLMLLSQYLILTYLTLSYFTLKYSKFKYFKLRYFGCEYFKLNSFVQILNTLI